VKTGKPIVILGVFVADTAYRAVRQPRMGETLLGSGFKLGPAAKARTRPSPPRGSAPMSASSRALAGTPLPRWH